MKGFQDCEIDAEEELGRTSDATEGIEMTQQA